MTDIRDIIDRNGALVAWGILAVLALFSVVGVIVPLASAYMDRSERIEQGYLTLAKLEAIARLRPDEISKQGAVVKKALEDYAFAGMDADRLTLELRKKIEALAEEYSVRLRSVEATGARREDDIQSVMLKIAAEAEPEGVIKLMESLRENNPLLAVDNLLLHTGTSSRQRRRRNRDAEAALTQPLGVTFTLEAFMVPRG